MAPDNPRERAIAQDPGRTIEYGVEVPRVDKKRDEEGEDFAAAERQRAKGREHGAGLEVGPVISHEPGGGASGGVAGGAEATDSAGENRAGGSSPQPPGGRPAGPQE